MNEKKVTRSALVTILQLLGVIFGVLAIVSGEFDDSPGLQGLGLILIVWAFFFHFRSGRSK